MAEFTDVDASFAQLEQEIQTLETQAVTELVRAAGMLMDELLERTPVWSGRAVRNFRWGVNGAGFGGEIEPIGGPGYVPGAGWRAQREIDPGPTNSMALGSEPRRPANEEAARAEMEAMLSGVTKLVNLSVTNTSSNWDLVDGGSAPVPGRSRTPGGVSALAEQATVSRLGDNWQ